MYGYNRYLGPFIKVRWIILELAVVVQMSGVIQLTYVYFILGVLFKVETDAVVLLITVEFTEILVQDFDGFYRVIGKTFVNKEEGRRKLHGAKSCGRKKEIK